MSVYLSRRNEFYGENLRRGGGDDMTPRGREGSLGVAGRRREGRRGKK